MRCIYVSLLSICGEEMLISLGPIAARRVVSASSPFLWGFCTHWHKMNEAMNHNIWFHSILVFIIRHCKSLFYSADSNKSWEYNAGSSCLQLFPFLIFRIIALTTLENHCTRTTQSSRCRYSRWVHKIVYLVVNKGNDCIIFLPLKIFIANYYHL